MSSCVKVAENELLSWTLDNSVAIIVLVAVVVVVVVVVVYLTIVLLDLLLAAELFPVLAQVHAMLAIDVADVADLDEWMNERWIKE